MVSNNYLDVNSSLAFTLPKSYAMDLYGYFNTAKQTGLSKTRAFGNVNLGVGKSFAKKHKLRLSISNILSPSRDWDIINEDGLNFNVYAYYNYSPRVYRLNYTLNFGKQKDGANKRKAASSQDVEGRVR